MGVEQIDDTSIMHSILDDYAHRSGLRKVSPVIKIPLALSSIMICIFSQSPAAPLAVAASMAAAIVILGRTPARLYVKLLAVPLSFALLSALAVLFTQGSGDALISFDAFGLGIGRDGLNLALLLIARTLGGMSSLFFIALTTPMAEIFGVLASIGMPAVLIDLSMLIYRYIFVLLGAAATIHSAQALRLGYSGIGRSIRSFGVLAGVLFLRSWEQGERLMVAMDARCYAGRLDVMAGESRATPGSALAALAYIVIMAAISFKTGSFHLV